MTQHTLSIGPLSLLASQSGPLLTITIHAPSDTAPVGKMTLTVPEWTSLVALVDCMGAAEKRHAEDKAEIERLSASVDRYQDAAWAGIEESSDNVECCAVDCSIVCASMNARASGWTINRNGLPFCSEHADRALNPTETKSDRDSLRQQVRELTEEMSRLRAVAKAARQWRPFHRHEWLTGVDADLADAVGALDDRDRPPDITVRNRVSEIAQAAEELHSDMDGTREVPRDLAWRAEKLTDALKALAAGREES